MWCFVLGSSFLVLLFVDLLVLQSENESWLLYFNSVVAICVLPYVSLQGVIVVLAYPGHTFLHVFCVIAS